MHTSYLCKHAEKQATRRFGVISRLLGSSKQGTIRATHIDLDFKGAIPF